jgi:transposase-like protein
MGGEPVSSLRWTYERDEAPGRVYEVSCGECAQVLFSREECPLCQAKGGIGRALLGRHGLSPPVRCPLCDYEELLLLATVRAQLQYTGGTLSRRVCAAEAHEPGFHVTQVDCPCCEQTVARTGLSCPACGRSSLMKKMG